MTRLLQFVFSQHSGNQPHGPLSSKLLAPPSFLLSPDTERQWLMQHQLCLPQCSSSVLWALQILVNSGLFSLLNCPYGPTWTLTNARGLPGSLGVFGLDSTWPYANLSQRRRKDEGPKVDQMSGHLWGWGEEEEGWHFLSNYYKSLTGAIILHVCPSTLPRIIQWFIMIWCLRRLWLHKKYHRQGSS